MNDTAVIRELHGHDEYRACVALQDDTWGPGFSETVAPAILKVAQILGGVAAGAWDADGRLIGFVFGLTGLRDGKAVHWSDMLAVRPEARGTGLGRRLKRYQRSMMLERGITTMHWSFDPLRARNAHLNFARLGITAPEYVQDMYATTGSPLHRGIGTDRLIARWELDAPRVVARLAGRDRPPTPAETARLPTAVEGGGGGPIPYPGPPRLGLDAPRLRIVVPPDIGMVSETDPDAARAWRDHTRAAFVHYLARGWVARDFVRHDRTPAYLLENDPS